MLSSILVLAVQVVPPIQQLGSICPLGYYGQSGYCVPTRSITPATQSIPKTSNPCPLGTSTSLTNYCSLRR